MDNAENKVIVDWLSFTVPFMRWYEVIEFLGMEPNSFTETKGQHGYKYRKYFDGISVHFGGDENIQPGVWVEMSGQGCRNFETYGHGCYEAIFNFILEYDECNLTRLDIAYDVFTAPDLLDNIIEYSFKNYVVSKFRTGDIVTGIFSNQGKCVNLGSHKSDIMLRVYDKKVERQRDDVDSWIRLELQLRDDNARSFISLPGLISDNFLGILNNYIRFVEPSESDSNKRRWNTALWWEEITKSVSKLSLTKPGKEYNELKLKEYVVNQAGQAVKSYIKLNGLDSYIELLNNHFYYPNVKYQSLGVGDINEKI